MMVDPQTYKLAGYFLNYKDAPPTVARQQSLAEAIQQAVEDWFLVNATDPAPEQSPA